MPDPILMIEAMGVAAVAAAFLFALFGRKGRGDSATRSACGWVMGLGIGSWLGLLVLDLRPRWPLAEDLDRFLGIVLPAFLGVELVLAILRWPGALRWLARGLVAAGAAPALLHGSSYLSDVAGPGTREWGAGTAVAILGVMALALVGEWLVVDMASRRRSAGVVAMAMAVATGGAAVALLLSGYASGGQMGLPLAAALAGLAAAMLVVPEESRQAVPVGPALGCLFGLLVIGRFFAGLTTAHGVLLLIAPLAGAACTLLLPRSVGRTVRSAAGLFLVIAIVGGVLASAGARFAAANRSPARSSVPSLEDYSRLEPTAVAPNGPDAAGQALEPTADSTDPISP
jgi:hypothetical protein